MKLVHGAVTRSRPAIPGIAAAGVLSLFALHPHFAGAAPPGPAGGDAAANVEVKGHIFEPSELPPPDLATLKVPKGFKVDVFGSKLGNARMLAKGELVGTFKRPDRPAKP